MGPNVWLVERNMAWKTHDLGVPIHTRNMFVSVFSMAYKNHSKFSVFLLSQVYPFYEASNIKFYVSISSFAICLVSIFQIYAYLRA